MLKWSVVSSLCPLAYAQLTLMDCPKICLPLSVMIASSADRRS
uniref:Uncharacterized protein n=1 Tax=Arundo donax TaxID=35708 RepID=A0A0A9EM61_ARUDO